MGSIIRELENVAFLRKKLDLKKGQLEALKKERTYIKAISYDFCKRSGGNTDPNKLSDKILTFEKEIISEAAEIIGRINEVRRYITKIDGDEGLVLEMKYLEGMDWQEISERIDRSLSQCFYLRRKGLETLVSIEKNKYLV
ncbi:DUF1492 domain-containing protein [Peptoniphilus sp. GNH]|nr:DUF1492 domain-containing protein [Peptoniphilus sp. GNH]